MELALKNQGYLYTFAKDSFKQGESHLFVDGRRLKKNEIILTIIADDHPYLIHGVETDLNKDPKIKIVATAESYDELLEQVERFKPQVVLLDLRMPGQEKYNLKNYISKLKSIVNCKVLVFSNETGWARIHRCLEVGANAFIEKAISIGRLAEFVRSVHDDGEFLIYTAEQLPQIQFSPRQRDILHYIADGKENNEIAKLLKIDIKTVQSYVNEIKSRLSEAFGIHLVRPRTLLLLVSKLGFGSKLI